MANLWHEIKNPGLPDTVFVVVESPKGSKNRFLYSEKNEVMRLESVLNDKYPGDYGFIPQTYAEDGEALDALVLVTNATYPGVVLKARPLAMLRMVDGDVYDDKIICVSVSDIQYAKFKDIKDLPPRLLKEIEQFFKVYKHLEGKSVKAGEWKGPAEAKKVIEHNAKLYERKFS